jgi:hypothetical protein
LLFHTTGNLAHFVFPAVMTTWGGLYSLMLNVVGVIVVVALWDPRRLARERHTAAAVPTGT